MERSSYLSMGWSVALEVREAVTAANAAAAAEVGAELLVMGLRLGWGLGTSEGCRIGTVSDALLIRSSLDCDCNSMPLRVFTLFGLSHCCNF